MTCVHRCRFCDGDFACDTMQEVSEDVYRCSCTQVDTCPGCSQHGACEDCEKAPATGDGHKPWLCDACEQDWLENYEPSEPDYGAVGINEQCEMAHRERAELRRRD